MQDRLPAVVAVLRRRTKKWILFHEEAGVVHNECSLHLVKCINRISVFGVFGLAGISLLHRPHISGTAQAGAGKAGLSIQQV